MRPTPRLAFIILLIAAVVAVAAWRVLSPPAVEVAPVGRGELRAALSAAGFVEARQATVAPRIVGRVAQLLCDESDPVTKGQLLARLDDGDQQAALTERQATLRANQAEVARLAAALQQERAASTARIARAKAVEEAARARLQELRAGSRPQEIAAARQNVAAARADADLAAAEWERTDRLFADGAVSRAEVDAAQARLASAAAALSAAREQLALVEEGARSERLAAGEADLAAAQAQLAEARAAAGQVAVLEQAIASAQAGADQAQAAVAAARSMLAETTVTAPLSGRVGRRYLDVGDLAGPTSPLFLITDDQDLWITAEVDEEDLALVHPGQQVEITAEALAQPLAGVIAEVPPVALPRGLAQVRAKIVRAKIALRDKSPLLRAGMEVDVRATAVLAEDALLVPTEALIETDQQPYVFLLKDGRLHRADLQLGRRSFREAQALSGLAEGDLVVVSDKEGLRDGQRARASRG